MPAVVRVKRRVDEEPLSAFVLNGKKRRLDDGTAEEAGVFAQTVFSASDDVSTVLKFAGTINQQDNRATTRFARLNKDAAKELVLQKSKCLTNVTERARQQTRLAMQENRFKIVNCMRTTLNFDDETEDGVGSSKTLQDNSAAAESPSSSNACVPAHREVTIVDIEKQNTSDTENSVSTSAFADASIADTAPVDFPTESEANYVYDLYLPENDQHAENVDLMDDNHLSVRAFDDIVYEDRFNNDFDDHDSEDSNREDFYTNDYPDEDDEFGESYENRDESGTEREIRNAVRRLGFGGDHDSSDEEFDPYREYENPLGRRFLTSDDHDESRGFGSNYDSDDYYSNGDQEDESDDLYSGINSENVDTDSRIM